MSAVDAYQSGACSCRSCASACTYAPGWFAPEQIAPLAAALDLTVEQLFAEHLQIDWLEDGDSPVFVLAPRLSGQPGASMYPADIRGIGCHWFAEGLCKIHEQGKPAECQRSRHDATGPAGRPVDIADRWRGEPQALIRKLYGGEPQAETLSLLAFLFGSGSTL